MLYFGFMIHNISHSVTSAWRKFCLLYPTNISIYRNSSNNKSNGKSVSQTNDIDKTSQKCCHKIVFKRCTWSARFRVLSSGFSPPFRTECFATSAHICGSHPFRHYSHAQRNTTQSPPAFSFVQNALGVRRPAWALTLG